MIVSSILVDKSLIISLLLKSWLDLCMEESTCIEIVIHLSQRLSSMLRLFIFLLFFISFKYDFHVDAERMIVKTPEM